MPHLFVYVPLVLAFIPISVKAIKKLLEKKIGTEFFLVVATIIAFVNHQEKAIGVVLIIMIIAQYLEKIIEKRTQHEIEGLISLIPTNALVKDDHGEKFMPINDIKVGMNIVVKTGGKIPVDGVIVRGEAAVNEASLTGESVCREKSVGQSVFAGTFIESGSIIIKTEKIGPDTLFGRISELVQQAEHKKAKVVVLADKIALIFVPGILLFIGCVWLMTGNINMVTTLLIFGSPLELTIITPLAILAGIIAAFKNGVLVKGGLVLERLAQAEVIIFDKTGTLTLGEPEVVKIEVYDSSYAIRDILKIAAIAEKRSDHVVAKAILKKAVQENIIVPDPDHYVSLPGHGVEIVYNNEKYFFGNKHFVEAPEHGSITIPLRAGHDFFEDYSSFYLGSTGTLHGMIYVADIIRPEAKLTIDELKNQGINTIILLSGDTNKVAMNIAQLLGIPVAHGDVFPDQKLLMIENLQSQNKMVAMVGDGINDAPALKQADVGIAMGAMGMEPAIEAADIVLMTNDLYKIVFVHALSKKIFVVIKQNLLIGFGLVHVLGALFTLFGFIDPLKAALLHAVSDLGILMNSISLINFKIDTKE